MLELDGLGALVVLGLWIFCLIDVITTDESLCRNLGKTMWLILVLFLPAIGSIAWLVAGRPQAAKSMPYKGNHGPAFPEYDRPGRAVAANPEDDEAFLRGLRERAEEQRETYRAKKRQELGEADPPPAT
jgi:hypothetical protein